MILAFDIFGGKSVGGHKELAGLFSFSFDCRPRADPEICFPGGLGSPARTMDVQVEVC